MDKPLETGTTHFLDRFALTRRLEENLEGLLADYGLRILTFGQTAILQGNSWMNSRLKKLDTKNSLAALMVKFSPDYVTSKESGKPVLFFLDAKASITPVFFGSQVDRIRLHSKQTGLGRSHIGEIEREAWFSYNTFYPRDEVAIIMASPYSTRLILAEWVGKIRCLWCYKGKVRGLPTPWDCDTCPVKTREGFGVIVNVEAGGSGTPHTNIDFRSMRTLPDFLEQELGIKLDTKMYNFTMLDFVKKWPLNKPAGTITWKQYNSAIRDLRDEGCTWLKYRMLDKFFDTYQAFDAYWYKNRG
jgi:hypothetical protein